MDCSPKKYFVFDPLSPRSVAIQLEKPRRDSVMTKESDKKWLRGYARRFF